MAKCNRIPLIKSKNGKKVPSILFETLMGETKNRYKTIQLWSVITSDAYRTAYPDLVEDQNGEPQLYENLTLKDKAGNEIKVTETSGEHIKTFRKGVLRKMRASLEKLIKNLPDMVQEGLLAVGLDHMLNGRTWNRIKKDVIDLQSVYGVELGTETSPVKTFAYLFDRFLSKEGKASMLEIYAGKKASEITKDEAQNYKYQMLLDYLAWRRKGEKDDTFSSKTFSKLETVFTNLYENTLALNEFFEQIDRGFFTMGIPTSDFTAQAADTILRIQEDFGNESGTLLDAVERFRIAVKQIRTEMRTRVYSVNIKNVDGELIYYFPTRIEAERGMKARFEAELDKAEKAMVEKFGTLEPSAQQMDSEGGLVFKRYHNIRTIYENFDKVINVLYPSKKRREINQYDELMMEESGEEVDIYNETIGAENFNAEATTSAPVKDFLATIRRGDGTFIRPRAAYLLAGRLLSGVDERKELFGTRGEVSRRAKLMGGPGSDAWYVEDALSKLFTMGYSNTLKLGKEERPIGSPKGRFLSMDYFESSDGQVRVTRKFGQPTPDFYREIQRQSGFPYSEIALAGQQFANSDLFNTIFSHFASLKEANYYFLETEEKSFSRTTRYRPSKQTAVNASIRENILDRIHMTLENGTFEKAFDTAMKEDITQEQADSLGSRESGKIAHNDTYRHLLRIERFLRELGLNSEANFFTVSTSPVKNALNSVDSRRMEIIQNEAALVDKIYADLVYGAERVKASVNEYKERLAEYERVQKEYNELDAEERIKTLDRVYEVFKNIENGIFSKPLKDDGTPDETVIVLKDLNETEMKVFRAKDLRVRPSLNVRTDINSFLDNISDLVNRNDDTQRPTSFFSKDNSKKYSLHNASNAWVTIQELIRHNLATEGNRATRMGEKFPFLQLPFYKENLFMKGKNKVHAWHDFDYTKSIDYKGAVDSLVYGDERFKEFFNRVLNGQFFDWVAFKKGENPRYVQSIPTISNRPTTFGVEIDLKGRSEIVEGLADTIRQLKLRDRELRVKGYNPDSTVNFRVLDNFLGDPKEGDTHKRYASIMDIPDSDIPGIAARIYDVFLREEALRLSKRIVEMRMPLHKNMVSDGIKKIIEPKDLETVEELINSGKETKALRKDGDKVVSVFKPEQLVPVMQVFVANNYLNSYHIQQLIIGDHAFFTSGADVVKRSGGAHAPGQRGRVHPKLGMPEKYRTLVIKDTVNTTKGMKETLEELGVKGKDLEDLLALYPGKYDVYDGFGVALPKRRRDIVRGFGSNYGVTNILKPAHYEVDQNGVPRMVKYSSLVLTDELVDRYPSLNILRDNLEALGMDEMVMASAVKTGTPAAESMLSIEDLTNPDAMWEVDEKIDDEGHVYYDGFKSGERKLDENSILTLSNHNYRLQHNPYHSLESSVANPTQLSYFLNALAEDRTAADRVYTAMAQLMRKRMKNVLDQGEAGIMEYLMNSLKGNGNEKLLEFLEAGISIQNPMIEKELYTKLSSMFRKEIIQIRFKDSQKLVAQPDMGITSQRYVDGKVEITGQPLKLDIIKKNGTTHYVAECILPKGALPKDIQDQIMKRLENNEEVFLTGGDALAFRIPSSELHSAVSLRVVGFTENIIQEGTEIKTNMIILPHHLIAVMGHDFDIDSFFVLQRQEARDSKGRLYFPGYEYKNGVWEFNHHMDVSELSDNEYEAYYKNQIIETFLETIEAPGKMRKRMLSPISFEPLRNDIKKIQELTGTKDKDFDLSNPNDNYDAFESSFSGAKGVGIIANAMKALAYSINSNNGSTPTINLKAAFGQKVVTLTSEGETLDRIREMEDQEVNLWMSLDGLLNSAIDNVKEQILPLLNIGDNTFKAYIAGRALGVRMEIMNRMMVQPSMKHISSLMSQFEINNSLNTLVAEAATILEENGEQLPDTVDLNIEELEKWLKYCAKHNINTIGDILSSGNKELIVAQAKIAIAYRQLNAVGNSISDLSRYLSIIRELPVTAPDMQKLMEVRSRIFNEDGSFNENFRLSIPDFLKENPHIEVLDKVLMEFYNRTRTMFEIHSPHVETLIEEVMGNIQSIAPSQETAQMLKEEYEKFILQVVEDTPKFQWDPHFVGYKNIPNAFNPRLGEELKGKEAFTFHVVNMVTELKKLYPANKFLASLSSTIEWNGASLHMHGAHNMEIQDHLEMRYYFLQLNGLEYDYETGEVKTVVPNSNFSQVQKDLMRYAMLKYGLKFGTKNFALAFPPQLIKMVDEQYVRAISSYDWKVNGFNDFAMQAVMSNPDLTRPNMERALWRGYDPGTKVHYDLKLNRQDGPGIIKKDNEFSNRLESTFYLNVTPPGATGSYYVEIGRGDRGLMYEAPSDKPVQDRFRGDIKNFKVSKIETDKKGNTIIRDTYTTRVPNSGIHKGSIVSVSTFEDPLRKDIKFIKVSSVKEGVITGKETKSLPSVDPRSVVGARPYNIKDEDSADYKRLDRILKRLKERTGIAYKIVSASEMESFGATAETKGMFRTSPEHPNGIVYVNYSTVSSDTPFHEYIHPFVHAVKLTNKVLYNSLVREMKADPYGQAVLEAVKAAYADHSESDPDKVDMEEEAVVTLIGQYAARASELKIRTSLRKLLIRVLEAISEHVRQLLGRDKVVTPQNIGKVTLQDLGLLFGVGDSTIKISSQGSISAESRLLDQIVEKSSKATVQMDENGIEADKYVMEDGSEFGRVSNFMGNFINRKMTDSKSIATRKADRLWKDRDPNLKLDTDLVNQEPMTKAEYIDKVEKMMEKGRIKGKLIHKKIQSLINPAKRSEIEAEMEAINKDGVVSKWEYLWIEDRIDELMGLYGVNLDPDLPEESRDKVESEVTVLSEELKIGGTMDMLVEHPDGKFSIIEWKSGRSFNDRIFDNLMKYGQQKVDITDNPKERAKLQVALYAVLLRMQNPEMEFRNLQVGWIPNEYQALRDNPTRYVEVDSYIPMIEAFFKDADALKEAGIDPEVAKKITARKDLFRVSAYSSYSSSSITDMLEQGRSLDNILEIKLNRLQAIQAMMDAEGKELKDLEKEERQEYIKLTEEIIELEKDPEMVLKSSLDKDTDIGMWTRWFGNAADVNNPLVAVWNKVRNQRTLEYQRSYQGKMNIFRKLLEPVMEEITKDTGMINIRKAGIMTGNYKEMFAWAYKHDEIPGRGKVRRFITKDDAEFNGPKMSDAKRALLNYLNDTVASYFVGQDAYLNQIVMEVEGKKGVTERLSHLDLMNRHTAEKDKLKLFYGFMPKVQMSMAEYMYKQGNNSLLRGAFSLANLKREWKMAMTFYEEKNYERWDVNQQALPIKYTGSPEIEASEEYTENIEVIFSRWVQHMEHKKHMDHVYALGRGVYNTLMERPEKERLANTANMLDDLLVKDVQGRMKQSKYTSKTFLVRTPGKKGEDWEWNDHGISFDKVLMFLNRWGSSVIMQFKPFSATGNAVHGTIIQGRRALVGNIMKLTGSDQNLLDYTLEDLAVGEKEYAKLIYEAATGDIRKNKLYMLAKELNYHPKASMYTPNREFISVRNRILDDSNKVVFHTIGEEYLAYVILAAQLNHIKLANGKSVYESYEVEEGEFKEPKLVWKGGIRGYVRQGSGTLTREIPIEGITAQESSRMKRIYELQQGSYRLEELAAMEVYAMGKMFVGLKRYMHRVLMVGLQSKKADYSQGFYEQVDTRKEGDVELPIYELRARMIEGRFKVLAKAMLTTVTAGGVYNDYQWKNLSVEDRQAVLDAALTAAMYGMAITAYYAMFDDKDDTDTIKKFWKRYLVDNPTQHWNPVDILRNPGQLVPVGITRLSISAQATAKMITALALYTVTGDRTDLVTQRGQLRGWNDFKKGVPYVAPVTDFIDKMRNQDLFPWYEDDNMYRM